MKLRYPASGVFRFLVLCLALFYGAPVFAKTHRVAPGGDLQAQLDAASEGDTVELAQGAYRGNFFLRKRITLRGKGATLDAGGRGTNLVVEAAGARVEGLSFRNSGKDLGAPDCCLYVKKSATRATIHGNDFEGCAFGIWIHETEHARITQNRIVGTLRGHRSLRGNAIHLFNASRLVVAKNDIRGGRDGIYVSATEDCLIQENVIRETRYGVHYMYSYRNRLIANSSTHNFSGYALMESRGIHAIGNRATDNELYGIMFRDVEDCKIERNVAERNGMGLFFYSSVDNVIRYNTVRHNEVGAKIWAGSDRNEVSSNAFIGNRTQVFYVSTLDLEWGKEPPGNFWADYVGWDQDGDGIGDRPYRIDSFSTRLIHRYPSAVLLLRSPALELLGHLEQSLPLLRVATLIDSSPQVQVDTP